MFKNKFKNFRNPDKGSVACIDDWQDDYDKMEGKVEDTKRIFGELHKKVGVLSSLDDEKIQKKSVYAPVKQDMETVCQTVKDPFLRKITEHLIDALSEEMSQFGRHFTIVDQTVTQPSKKLEEQCKQLLKSRKSLSQQYADLNSRKAQIPSDLNGPQTGGGGHPLVIGTPSDNTNAVNKLKDQVEELTTQCSIAREKYIKELFEFASGEEDRANLLLTYLQHQRDYHAARLKESDLKIAKLRDTISTLAQTPMYGVELNQHLQRNKCRISLVIKACADALLNPYYIREQGLFRISPSKTKGDAMISQLNAIRQGDSLKDISDCNAVAYALKHYIGTLPLSLMREDLVSWKEVLEKSPDDRPEAIRNCLKSLQESYVDNLGFLCQFLWIVTQFSDKNNMSSYNMAVVFGPNLFHNGGTIIADWQLGVVKLLIDECQHVFPVKLEDNFGDYKKRVELVKPPVEIRGHSGAASPSPLVRSSILPPALPAEPPSFPPPPPIGQTAAPTFSTDNTSSAIFSHKRGYSTGNEYSDSPSLVTSSTPVAVIVSAAPYGGGDEQRKPNNLNYSPSMALGSRIPPSRPSVGPVAKRPGPPTVTKRAPPPPPEAVPPIPSGGGGAGVEPNNIVISFESGVGGDGAVMRSKTSAAGGSSFPTPAPRKAVQSAFITNLPTPPSKGMPVSEDDSRIYPSLDGLDQGGAKPPRPTVPPVKPGKANLLSESGTVGTTNFGVDMSEEDIHENTYL